MEYHLTLREAFSVIKRAWRWMLACMVIFGLLGAVFSVTSFSRTNDIDEDELEENTAEIEAYEKWVENKEITIKDIQEEILSAYARAEESPLMQIDAYHCNYHKICIDFDSDSTASRSDLINTWLVEKFGDPYSKDATYLFEVYGSDGEATIIIWGDGVYDLSVAVKEMSSYIEQMAENNSIDILAMADVEVDGYSQQLFELQDSYRNNVIRLQNELASYNSSALVHTPSPISQPDRSVGNVALYVLLGTMIGLFIGAVLSLYNASRKGILLSESQVEEVFQLVKLGEYQPGNVGKLKMLSSIIDVQAADDKRIVLFNSTDSIKVAELIEGLNSVSTRSFISGGKLIEEDSILECMTESDSLIIPLCFGRTTTQEIQTCIQMAQWFKKEVLGYIIVEE